MQVHLSMVLRSITLLHVDDKLIVYCIFWINIKVWWQTFILLRNLWCGLTMQVCNMIILAYKNATFRTTFQSIKNSLNPSTKILIPLHTVNPNTNIYKNKLIMKHTITHMIAHLCGLYIVEMFTLGKINGWSLSLVCWLNNTII